MVEFKKVKFKVTHTKTIVVDAVDMYDALAQAEEISDGWDYNEEAEEMVK